MDKVVLNKEQLKELKWFIHSRGFLQPLVVMEILDHFACMVEDMMQEDKELTLKQAMIKAHASLGVMGFRPIADAVEKGRERAMIKLAKHKML
jgi:hypothetical protein